MASPSSVINPQFVNPKINGELNQLSTLLAKLAGPSNGTVKISGNQQIPSTWGPADHLQGIAVYNGTADATGFISASAEPGFFLGFAQNGSNSASVQSVSEPNASYNHIGGFQMLGSLLPVPMEGDDVGAIINMYAPYTTNVPNYQFTIIPTGDKASAVGITNYTDTSGNEWALMCSYLYDPYTLMWFQAPQADVLTQSAWSYIATTSLTDYNDSAQFQAFALVTVENPSPGTDVVNLIGFADNEQLYQWTVNTYQTATQNPSLTLTWLETFSGWTGANWRYAAGLQIVSPTQLQIYGSPADVSGSTSSYSFELSIWS